MNSIDSLGPSAWRYRCIYFPYHIFSSRNGIEKAVQDDLLTNNFTLEKFVSRNIVLDFTSEGHDSEIIDNLIAYLCTITDIKKIRVLFNTKIDTLELPYQYALQTTWMVDHCKFLDDIDVVEDLSLNNKFLCLNGRPTLSRARMLSTLLNCVGTDIVASFGSNSNVTDALIFQEYFANHKLPLLVDGMVLGSNGHRYQNNNFNHYLFNIVSETSSQTDPISWRKIFVTEKTYKSFAWLHVPIWFAVPELVKEVRDQGFDVFDDIIDHSYDNIVNEEERMNFIANLVSTLNQTHTLEDCQQLRTQLMPRLLANRRHLEQMSRKQLSNYVLLLNKLAVD